MSEEPVERRLAAILAADVAGYSRLIGDGLLAEFASTVDALRCASEIQAGIADQNAGVPPADRIEFRLGIHQGDIVVEDRDIFGDGVNIAARLEALAEPRGICVSARVQEDAVGKLDLAFHDLGEQQLKNIVRPVRAYSVGRDRATRSRPAAVDVPRLSIVVLPFGNLNNDPEQQYFVDGISEDLTTDLSRIGDMLVISRTLHSPTKASGLTRGKSAASWACATCWRGACAGSAIGFGSTPS